MSNTISREHVDAAHEVVPGHEVDAHEVDWQGWVDSWDAQQAGYVVEREARISFMFDVLERLDAAPGTLLDLAGGPGTIAERALRRFPTARVLTLDVDPFLMELGWRTLGDRVEWIDADLRAQDWGAKLDDGLDAVCSATALHWLEPCDVQRLAQVLAAKLRPGGVFLNYDSLLLSREDNPRLSALATGIRHEHAAQQHAHGAQEWQAWWDAAKAEPAFAALLAERERIFSDRRARGVERADMTQAFRDAGFAEVDTLAQTADRHLLAAIR